MTDAHTQDWIDKSRKAGALWIYVAIGILLYLLIDARGENADLRNKLLDSYSQPALSVTTNASGASTLLISNPDDKTLTLIVDALKALPKRVAAAGEASAPPQVAQNNRESP